MSGAYWEFHEAIFKKTFILPFARSGKMKSVARISILAQNSFLLWISFANRLNTAQIAGRKLSQHASQAMRLISRSFFLKKKSCLK